MIEVRLKWAYENIGTTNKEIAITVDILRASTVITTALYYGAKWILPTLDIQTAFELAKKYNAILMGERKGLKITGFDFGDSPLEIKRERIIGRKIVFTSTNFPKAFFESKKSPIILIGSILKASAVTELAYTLAIKKGYDICFMLAGHKSDYSYEDLAFAGVSGIILKNYNVSFDKKVKYAIDFISENGLEKCIRESPQAKKLIHLGYNNDIEFASKMNLFNIIPIARENKIMALSNDGINTF